MHVLITGADGFIGAHLAAWLAAAGHTITGSSRNVRAARRRFPGHAWCEADFRRPVDWQLDGIEAVINCVGVLQDGGADSTHAAHIDGARALFDACSRAGVRRVIHLSAVGAEPAADTAYARTKHVGDQELMARDLDWTVLKPSLVLARGVYGGTALLRGLAGVPWITPLIASRARFRPIHMRDLCVVVERLLRPDAPLRTVLSAAGPQEVTLAELVHAERQWLGFGPARPWVVPAALAALAVRLGDMLGALGWRSALRSTSVAQMAHDVGGDPEDLTRQLGFVARPFAQALNEEPASVQDRWHARLYFVKPAARLVLAAFWIVSGIVCLTVGREAAMALARSAGFVALDGAITFGGGLLDIVLGVGLLLPGRGTRAWLAVMAMISAVYLVVLSLCLPVLWADPLGRLVKLMPFFALLACLAAVDDER